jgi:hypothetical protein
MKPKLVIYFTSCINFLTKGVIAIKNTPATTEYIAN